MSTKRKPPSRNPAHPGGDTLWVMYPDLAAMPPEGVDLVAWCEEFQPETRTDQVTRDEFVRRMAGNPILNLLHQAGRGTRVISLLDTSALAQWLATQDKD